MRGGITDGADASVVPIAGVRPGKVVRVRGTIGSIRVEPHGAAPALTASIDDGTGVIDAIFMGRRAIPGIEPGRVVTIRGRVAHGDGGLHLFNPWYELERPEA